ncbi:hypothetical protein DSO57_1011421 [Entomophthora muscae]|uniref:Uncharacterized protein n=1 Tax=Entomophthora muscae TaxID=34485 RepID=A0ACC2UT98_9FUNG|nr:hypothetical protein DSO57_1011421 [Entomophthora muscae]
MLDCWVHKVCEHFLDPALVQFEELTQLDTSDILIPEEIVTQGIGSPINLEQVELSVALGIIEVTPTMLQCLQDGVYLFCKVS